MPIHFSTVEDENYFIAKFVGKVSDDDLLDAYKAFLESDDWNPALNELTDLSELNGSDITPEGLNRLAYYFIDIFKKYNASPIVSIYAPENLAYGLSRMYAVLAEEFETLRVFKDLPEAKEWLASNVSNQPK